MEMEQRVRRLERSNKGLTVVGVIVFCLWMWFHGPRVSDILVGKQVTTAGIVVMDQIGPHQKPRVPGTCSASSSSSRRADHP